MEKLLVLILGVCLGGWFGYKVAISVKEEELEEVKRKMEEIKLIAERYAKTYEAIPSIGEKKRIFLTVDGRKTWHCARKNDDGSISIMGRASDSQIEEINKIFPNWQMKNTKGGQLWIPIERIFFYKS